MVRFHKLSILLPILSSLVLLGGSSVAQLGRVTVQAGTAGITLNKEDQGPYSAIASVEGSARGAVYKAWASAIAGAQNRMDNVEARCIMS